MSKKEQTEKFFEFIKKWNFKDFEAFEKHYDYLMSLKNREQLMVENEAMKETIAELLAQKKTTTKELKQQLAEKDKEIENLNNRLDKYIGGKLKSMLDEKDKEIKELREEHLEMFGDMKGYKNLWLAEQRKNKEIRKQVCDEIREYIKKFESIENEKYFYPIMQVPLHTFLNHIDKLEKGE